MRYEIMIVCSLHVRYTDQCAGLTIGDLREGGLGGQSEATSNAPPVRDLLFQFICTCAV